MQKAYILILTLLISQPIFSQTFFEGDITYKFDLQKKDSAFDETSIITYPAKTTTGIYKNGDCLQKPDSGIIEYSYFSHKENKLYWKGKGADTLLYELGNESRESEVDSTLTTKIEYNTDTILGFPCNRLIIQTSNLKLTFIYTPSFAINPVWSILQTLSWTQKTLTDIKSRLDKANCIGVSNGEPTSVNFQRSGFGMYSYELFSRSIPDSIKSNYNDSCTHILYKDKVVLQYGGGVYGPQCFPKLGSAK